MGNSGKVLMLFKGDYNASTTYQKLNVVYYNNRSYVCKQTSTGNAPTNTTYWQALTGDASAEIQALTNEVRGNWGTGGVNLFNKNDVLDATYIDTSTGNLSTTGGTGWITTKPIPLNDNTKVTYSGNSVDAVNAVRYRILQNDTVVSFNGLRANTDTIIITQGNYIQFSLRADTQNTFQIEYGATASAYQPYAKTNVELTQGKAEKSQVDGNMSGSNLYRFFTFSTQNWRTYSTIADALAAKASEIFSTEGTYVLSGYTNGGAPHTIIGQFDGSGFYGIHQSYTGDPERIYSTNLTTWTVGR